jgi:plastocyanin
MMWLLRICFSAVLVLSLSAATVTGRVVLRDSREKVVRVRSDYSGVVVWLEMLGAPLNSGWQDHMPIHAKMIQKNKTFTPHVLAVRVGTTVDFPNFDPIFHNAFSVYDGQLFDIGLYPPGTSRSIRFTRPGFVRVFCNIHSTMSAVIVVIDTPLFAMSQSDGSFAINQVPRGDFELNVFHERATDETLQSLRRRVTVDQDRIELPEIAISETGYLALPHKNKYGREYTAPPDDTGIYPATRK